MEELKEDIRDIKNDVQDIKLTLVENTHTLKEHTRRTTLNEARIEKIEYTILGLLGSALVAFIAAYIKAHS